jgi:CheY-like chemotaxis protein
MIAMNIALSTMNSTPLAENTGNKHAGKRILVVDDNVDAAESAAEILRLLGNEVLVAHDGLAAVDAVEEWHPEIVLLDIGLPGIDGYEVAKRVRQTAYGKNVRLVALTGWGQDQDRQRTSDSGFDQHWVKPVGLEKLKEISSGS